MEIRRMDDRLVKWIDGEDGFRGGTIYQILFHQFMLENNDKSRYIVTRKGFGGVFQRLRLVASSWCMGHQIRATLPRELPLLLMSKCKQGYVQSPVEQWSLFSRLGLWLLKLVDKSCITAVSRTTRDSVLRNIGLEDVRVEYAKIREEYTARSAWTQLSSTSLTLVLLDGGRIDKGYLRHLAITTELADEQLITLEVYGPKGMKSSEAWEVNNHGYVMNPFIHARKRNLGKRILYLGCSRFEGLHMAIVEAGEVGIPSIMSDIPAHRELEKLSGYSLLIGKTTRDDIDNARRMLVDEEYREMGSRSRELFDKFREASRKEES